MHNHLHNEAFCLTCSLSEVTKLFPVQGPIKDFIHLNRLEVFVKMPFDRAVEHASRLFKARSYMELSYYRDKYNESLIFDHQIDKTINKLLTIKNKNEEDLARHALFNFTEIIDEKTCKFLLRQKEFSSNEIMAILNMISRDYYRSSDSNITLRQLIYKQTGVPIDHYVNPVLFRFIGAFLDQGVTLWPYLHNKDRFLETITRLIKKSRLPLANFVNKERLLRNLEPSPNESVPKLLSYFFASTSLYGPYVKESLLYHPGWSGMIHSIASHSEMLAKRFVIGVDEMLAFKLALKWEYICHLKKVYRPIHEIDWHKAQTDSKERASSHTYSLAHWFSLLSLSTWEQQRPLIGQINLSILQRIWHESLENSYYESASNEIKRFPSRAGLLKEHKKFQVVFCIDDREASFRRLLEQQNESIETFSFPGFFGIDCFFKSHQKDVADKLCPVPVTPKHLIMEAPPEGKPKNSHNNLIKMAAFISSHGANNILFGFVSAYTLGHLSLFKLITSFFHPLDIIKSQQAAAKEKRSKLIYERTSDQRTIGDLFLGYSEQEMADRVYNVLVNIGLYDNLAPFIFFIGHGSSSVNNPHFAAYDCGACSSRPGSVNARVFAAMANKPAVRKLVNQKGLSIPKHTIFIGGFHDTCTDHIELFDTDEISLHGQAALKEFTNYLSTASGKNAQERCKWFALVPREISEKKALLEVAHRSRALFEPRPELGHTNNALCIIGRRMRTYQMNFERQTFLQSYDPFIDPDGTILLSILSAAIPVCGGINFDYYFSKIDPAVYGCGTKLSHNVCGLLGVGHGLDDDLRTGLPIQMTELHDPIRLFLIIEQTPEIILKTIRANDALLPWINNAWIKLAALDPDSDQISHYDSEAGLFLDAA